MRILAGLILGLLLAGLLLAGPELVLQDGRVLKGVDVRRDGDLYLLEQETGEVVPIPVELVREVRLIQSPPKPDPRTGLTYRDEPKTLAGSSKRPEGVKVGEGQTLAGQKVTPPKTSDQLKALGPPSKFSKDIIDPSWTPSSDWTNDPENNNFNPSTWSKGVVDSEWEPQSGFKDKDVLESGRSSWSKGPVDNEWVPQDGFKKN